MSVSNLNRITKQVFREHKNDMIKAQVTALNRSGVSAYSNTSKEVRQDYRIKASSLKRAVKFYRANRSRLTYRMVFNDYGLPLYKFANKQGARGVRAEMLRGKKILYRGTFIATMPSGHIGIFARKRNAKAKKNKRGRWTQLPIKELRGLSVGRIFKATGFVDRMGFYFYTKYETELFRALKYGR